MTATVAERGQRGVKRVLEKLSNSIELGDYYEAHQMYRTLYFRFMSQHKYKECSELLLNGADKLLQCGQEPCAVDLAVLLIDTLEKQNLSDDEEEIWIERLGNFIKMVNAGIVERETLINRAIKWSAEASGNSQGHPLMHKYVADVFWSEGNIEQARHHFLLCRDGISFGRFLIKLQQTSGYKCEVDLFIVQAVLQQLCLNDRETARKTFTTYTTYHPLIRRKSSPYRQPLLNFLHFLLLCIDSGNLERFRALCDLYKLSLRRDPSFEKYLIKIGGMYFGAPPPPSTMFGGGGLMGGVFGDLFSRLILGLDENADTDSDEPQNGPTNVSTELD